MTHEPLEPTLATTETSDAIPFEVASARRIPVATIALHTDLARVGEEASFPALATGRAVEVTRFEPVFRRATDGAFTQGLLLAAVSRTPVRLKRDGDVLRVESGKTTVLVDGRPVDGALSVPWAELERGVVLELGHRVVLLLHMKEVGLGSEASRDGLVGASEAVARLRSRIVDVARLDLPVLIRGETGSGKELVARAVHAQSGRRGHPLVDVSMAAIPETTAASALFGHERGAFTGATGPSRGYFGQADGGSLFLDEIGETPLALQAMMLRTLETSTVQRVGASRAVPVDVRLITATDADLEAMVEAGRFKAPLFHRLSRVVLGVPPLRERREDIARLFVHFLRESPAMAGNEARLAGEEPWIPTALVREMLAAPWVGNVRQLRNFADGVALSNRGGGGQFRLDADVAATLRAERREAASAAAPAGADAEGQDRSDAEVLAALEANDFAIRPTAKALGVAPNTLYRRLEVSGLARTAKELSEAEISEALTASGNDVVAAAKALRVSAAALKRRISGG